MDGKPFDGWDAPFFSRVFGTEIKHAKHMQLSDTSVDGSTAIRAGDSLQLIAVRSTQVDVEQAVLSHDVRLRFCYCSINGKCWTLDSAGPRSNAVSVPVAVAACTKNYSIDAPSGVFTKLKR